MSHIFDALQRSEDERAEIDSAAPSQATDLLRRAERRASSSWEAAVLSHKNIAADNRELETSIRLEIATRDATVQDATAVNVQTLADRERDIFSQFAPLQLNLGAQNRLVCFSDDESPAAEAFRLLAVRLRNLRRDRALKRILITSTVPQEGKSMVAANLASTLALTTQHKVLLVDGDLRNPSLPEKFGIGKNPGLFECLKGERTLTQCIYHLIGARLWILPAGSVQNNPLELLQSSQLSEHADHLTEWFDWIIIDSPPVLPLGDTSVWARLADGILLVTRQGTTEKRHLQRGLEALEHKKVIGALLNCSQSSSKYDYYYRATNVPQSTHESIGAD